jgi:hypothetical protein
VVYYHTRDIPSKNPGRSEIRGQTLDLLKQLLHDGYVYSIRGKGQKFHTLQKRFPMIQHALLDGTSMYFLEEQNKKGLQAMLESQKSRIFSYHDLASMSRVFDVYLKHEEKHRFLGKKTSSRKRKARGTKSEKSVFSREKQSLLDDFLGRFLHSEVLLASSSESILPIPIIRLTF